MSNNYLFGNRNQFFGSEFSMDEHSKIVGANVARYRNKAGMSQKVLAKAIGADSANTIGAIETGQTKKSKYLPDIARVLKVSLTDLDPTYEQYETVIVPSPQSGMIRDTNVYASVECGDGTLIYSTSEPISMVERPTSLVGIRGGFGVLVVGDSMIPLVRPGDTVWINPHLPPRQDDLCLFYAEKDGEFRATLKEFRSQNGDKWDVKRYKPKEKLFSLPKKDWPSCFVVVGRDMRR